MERSGGTPQVTEMPHVFVGAVSNPKEFCQQIVDGDFADAWSCARDSVAAAMSDVGVEPGRHPTWWMLTETYQQVAQLARDASQAPTNWWVWHQLVTGCGTWSRAIDGFKILAAESGHGSQQSVFDAEEQLRAFGETWVASARFVADSLVDILRERDASPVPPAEGSAGFPSESAAEEQEPDQLWGWADVSRSTWIEPGPAQPTEVGGDSTQVKALAESLYIVNVTDDARAQADGATSTTSTTTQATGRPDDRDDVVHFGRLARAELIPSLAVLAEMCSELTNEELPTDLPGGLTDPAQKLVTSVDQCRTRLAVDLDAARDLNAIVHALEDAANQITMDAYVLCEATLRTPGAQDSFVANAGKSAAGCVGVVRKIQEHLSHLPRSTRLDVSVAVGQMTAMWEALSERIHMNAANERVRRHTAEVLQNAIQRKLTGPICGYLDTESGCLALEPGTDLPARGTWTQITPIQLTSSRRLGRKRTTLVVPAQENEAVIVVELQRLHDTGAISATAMLARF
jgi:hypothetical protein